MIFDKPNYISFYFQIRCTLCSAKFVGVNKTSFRRHVSTFHPDMMARIYPARCRRTVQSKSAEKPDIRKWLVALVSAHGRPLQIVNDTPMKKMLSLATRFKEKFPYSQLKADIDIIADDVKKTIIDEIKGKPVSLMLDIVTKHCRSFLGVNIQYIHEDKLVLRTIGMIGMDQPHTGTYISELVYALANDFGLDGTQIYSMTTDNAKNIVKSIRDLSTTINQLIEYEEPLQSMEEFEATDNSYVMDDIDFEALSNVLDVDVAEEKCIKQQCTLDKDVIIESHPMDDIISDFNKQMNIMNSNEIIIEGLACAAHTLQLAIMDALRSWCDTLNLISKCMDIVKYVRTPNVRRLLKQQGLPVPNLSIVTRWNSLYMMVILSAAIITYSFS